VTIVVDQVNAGIAANDAASASLAVNTTATIASGAVIIAQLTLWHATATITAPTGGGLTWTVAVQGKHSGGNPRSGLAWAYAPSGLASGTAITANFSTTVNGRGIGLTSFTGVDSVTPIGTTSGPTSASATTAWASASTSIGAGSALIAAANHEIDGSSTTTAPSVETVDANGGAGTFIIVGGYRIEVSSGAVTVAGTFTSSANTVICAAELLPGTAAVAPAMPPTFNAIPFITVGGP
jgi:hypothetical protein